MSLSFDAVAEGDSLEPRIVEEVRGEDMKLMAALLQDPYPPHFDERRAEELGYPGLLNQGPTNLSFILQAITEHLDSPTDVRTFDVRFHDMVFEDETLRATATVAEKAVEDGTNLVTFDVALEKEDGAVAVDGTVTAEVA